METFGKETPQKYILRLRSEVKRHFDETYQKLDYLSQHDDQADRFGYTAE